MRLKATSSLWFTIMAITASCAPAQSGKGSFVSSPDDKMFYWKAASGPDGQRDQVAEPLYTAVIEQNHDEVKHLLDSGARPNRLLADDCWSVLMISAAEDDLVLTEMLIKHGADLNYNRSHPTDFSALSVALNYGIPRQDFTTFKVLLNSGADINASYIDRGGAVVRDGNGDAFTKADIAIDAAVLGQMNAVNELLARGYHRDLPELLIALKIRGVSSNAQPDKEKAISNILGELTQPQNRPKIPALLDHLKAIIANKSQQPWVANSPHLDPEQDKEVKALERILES